MEHPDHQRSGQADKVHFTTLLDTSTLDLKVDDLRVKAGFILLLEGYLYACELGRDRWEFASEIDFLHEAGLNNNDLRWLAGKGYVKHALQATAKGRLRKISHGAGRLMLPKQSCFVLTDTGVEFVRKILAAPEQVIKPDGPNAQPKDRLLEQKERPYWDSETHTLYWRGRFIKHFKHEAPIQEAILEAFQLGKWPQSVVVRLPEEKGVNVKARIHDAIKNLNRSCSRRLRFTQEGNGGRVGWQSLN